MDSCRGVAVKFDIGGKDVTNHFETMVATDSQRGSSGAGRAPGLPDSPARTHYTIGEVAREFAFTLRALRFYEEKGLISPRRTGNRRLYSETDRRRLEIIASGKKIGLSLDDIRDILKADKSDSDQTPMLETALGKAVSRLDMIEQEKALLQTYTHEALKLIDDLKAKLG